jgi:hypothetical protein
LVGQEASGDLGAWTSWRRATCSARPGQWWDPINERGSIGERVFIRTKHECPQGPEEMEVFRIEIVR